MNVSSAARRAAVVVSVVALSTIAAQGCRKQGVLKVPEDAVAMVGDRPITRAQLQQYIDRLPPVLRQQYASPESRKPLLDALVRNELLLHEARRRGLDNDPEYRDIVDQQLIALLIRKSVEGPDSTKAIRDDEIERFYREHTAQFSAPEQVRVSQIVVPDKALAARLLKQVRGLRRDDAAGFAAIAAKHSIDAPSREKGGDTGFISRDSGAYSPTVRAAAFQLQKPGDVADLVETEHGVHILRLTDRRVAAARPLSEVKEQIRQLIAYQKRTSGTDALIAESRAHAKVQILDARLGAGPAPVAATTPRRDGK